MSQTPHSMPDDPPTRMATREDANARSRPTTPTRMVEPNQLAASSSAGETTPTGPFAELTTKDGTAGVSAVSGAKNCDLGLVEEKRARWREQARRYRLAHPERIAAKYAANAERYKENARRWREENPEYHREWRRADRAKHPAKWLDVEHRRKALKREAFVEAVDRRKVFERDGWLCGICGELVDREARAPDPRSPSLDHVVPLARGGEHSYANVQCAHFFCNSVKSDRLEGAL